jgi:2-phospho-L-lactate/phosphoenolpyruvate guanylyltransferase
MPSRSQDAAGIVVPLRSFTLGKARLAAVLSEPDRETLARSMAESVANAAAARPVVVVSSAAEVVAWARERAFGVVDALCSLDAATPPGRAWAIDRGLTRYAVVHADLPFAASLDAVVGDGDAAIAVIVPDHRDDGTPVLSLPTATPFTFAYGPGSAARHVAEAERRSLLVRIVRDPALGFDVDIADDLAALEARRHPSPQ